MRDIDDTQAPLLDHLIELRRRLLYCVATLVLTFALCFYFVTPIFTFLVHPLVAAGQNKIIFTQIFEAFIVQVKVAFFAAMMLSFPVIANQLWQFVAPGLYRAEKKALLPFLLATPLLFLTGASLAYYVAIPLALKFLLSYQGDFGGIQQEALPAVGSYLGFIMQFLFAFGITFLLPVLLMLLERAGNRDLRAVEGRVALCGGGCLRDRGGADAARYRIADATRGAAVRTVLPVAGGHLVHAPPSRAAGQGRGGNLGLSAGPSVMVLGLAVVGGGRDRAARRGNVTADAVNRVARRQEQNSGGGRGEKDLTHRHSPN